MVMYIGIVVEEKKELEEGQSMSQLLLKMSWSENFTLVSTHIKILVYHKYHKYN